MRRRRLSGLSARPLNFTVRRNMQRRRSLRSKLLAVAVFAIGTTVSLSGDLSRPHVLRIILSLLLFGAFCGYLFAFDHPSGSDHPAGLRAGVGSCVGLVICALQIPPVPAWGWLVAAAVGAVLGYFGSKWARHV